MSMISQGQEAKPVKLQVVQVSEDLLAATVLLHTLLSACATNGSRVCCLPLGYRPLPVCCISPPRICKQKRDYLPSKSFC